MAGGPGLQHARPGPRALHLDLDKRAVAATCTHPHTPMCVCVCVCVVCARTHAGAGLGMGVYFLASQKTASKHMHAAQPNGSVCWAQSVSMQCMGEGAHRAAGRGYCAVSRNIIASSQPNSTKCVVCALCRVVPALCVVFIKQQVFLQPTQEMFAKVCWAPVQRHMWWCCLRSMSTALA